VQVQPLQIETGNAAEKEREKQNQRMAYPTDCRVLYSSESGSPEYADENNTLTSARQPDYLL